MSSKLIWALSLAMAMAAAGGAEAAGRKAGPVYKAEIARTRYGVPHITAADYGGVGYGEAYAYLEDNLCLIADKVVTVNGERSQSAQRSRSSIPAARAMRSSSAGWTARNGGDSRSHAPSMRLK